MTLLSSCRSWRGYKVGATERNGLLSVVSARVSQVGGRPLTVAQSFERTVPMLLRGNTGVPVEAAYPLHHTQVPDALPKGYRFRRKR